MSVHFRGSCYVVDDVICKVECETKWKPTQPRLVMQGWCNELSIIENKAYIL